MQNAQETPHPFMELFDDEMEKKCQEKEKTIPPKVLEAKNSQSFSP